MPTSSIFHNITLTDPDDIERFVDALEESQKWNDEHPRADTEPIEMVTDESEIRELFKDGQLLGNELPSMS